MEIKFSLKKSSDFFSVRVSQSEEEDNTILTYKYKPLDLKPELEELGAKIFEFLQNLKYEKISLDIIEKENISPIVKGLHLASWEYTKHKKSNRELKELEIIGSKESEEEFNKEKKIIESIFLAKDLVYTPGNILFPATFISYIQDLFKNSKIEITILDEKELKKLGLNLILAVGSGSVNPPRLVILKKGPNPKKAIIGKGVTFDTGGISLKPSDGMEEMIGDMTGAAVVTGIMNLIKDEDIDLYGIFPLAENMPSGSSCRPGDIVQSGPLSVEILNTDAEGRLIMGDAVHYACSHLKCEEIISICTLTGASRVVLGTEYACLCTQDQDLIRKLEESGRETGEEVWSLPFGKVYDRHIDSKVADIKNVGISREAGVISGGKFIERFAQENGVKKFAHIDIGAVSKINGKYNPFGIKLLYNYLHN